MREIKLGVVEMKIHLQSLQGLCKKLRLQGVDAIALESYEHHDVAKEIAEKQDRMILTKSIKSALRLKQIFRKEHVLCITEETMNDQVKLASTFLVLV